MAEPKEPQSYGSGKDWVTGRTGQQVQDQKSTPPPEQADFYDNRRESEENAPGQGGTTSEVQRSETGGAALRGSDSGRQPVSGVTAEDGGAKRDSFFRKRDYQ